MVNITASELNKRTGFYLQKSMREPVVIEKSGHPFAVMFSYEDYKELAEEFQRLEDEYWGQRAREVEERGNFLSHEESMAFLLSIPDEE